SASGNLDLSDLAALTSDEGPGLDVTLGPLTDIVVTTAGASGSGTYRVGSLGPVSVAPIPWSLSARWTGVDAPYATLTSDASALTIELEDGALWLSGAAAVPLAYAGEDLVMHLAVGSGDGRVQVGDLAAIPVRGSLEQLNGGAALLAMSSTLGELLVAGEVPTALLAAPLPAQAQVDGGLSIDAVLDLMAGPDFAASVVLSAAGATLTGDVSGS